jgi:hypothetical protein
LPRSGASAATHPVVSNDTEANAHETDSFANSVVDGRICDANNPRDGASAATGARRRNRCKCVLHPSWRSYQRLVRCNVFAKGRRHLERNQEGGAFNYEEKGRDEQAVELFDSGRSTSILFYFVNKTIRAKAGNSDTWKDQYFILNATDEPASADCVAFASRSAARASPRADGASPVPTAPAPW